MGRVAARREHKYTYKQNDLSMEKVLLFDTPVKIDHISADQKEKIIDVPAFGVKLPDCSYSPSDLAGYIGYLVAAQKWDSLGGDVDLNNWTTKEGIHYGLFDAEIQAFIEQANREFPVSARIYETPIDLNGQGVVNTFVVGAALADKIREEGHLLDVRIPPLCQIR